MMTTSTEFSAICSPISVMEYLSYREYLAALYAEVKSRSKRYSYQKFAMDLGFSLTNVLRLVIVGKRRLTPSATQRIVVALTLEGPKKAYFIALVRYNNARMPDQRERLFQELIEIKGKLLPSAIHQSALEYFSEWYHPIIREMVGMKGFESNVEWIAGQLFNGLMPRQVEKSLELLERLELIKYNPRLGRYVQIGGQLTPDRAVENLAAVRFHQKMIEIGKESITRVEHSRREIHSLSVCVSEGTAEKIKGVLLKTCEEIFLLEKEGDEGEQIYQINLQLFPFTKIQP